MLLPQGANLSRMQVVMDADGNPEITPNNFTDSPSFDIIEWHPAYQSCQKYFINHAQHEPSTIALCSLINIRLPHQWPNNSTTTTNIASPVSSNGNGTFMFPRLGGSNVGSPTRSRGDSATSATSTFVSLIPYVRRLVVTGFDKPAILHGFFGDDYTRGILPHVDCERRNYLFAAKHGGWGSCKRMYDHGSTGGDDETVPFLKPLDEARIEELTAAEKAWSNWLAMEDWMVGPRSPNDARQDDRNRRRSWRERANGYNNASNGA